MATINASDHQAKAGRSQTNSVRRTMPSNDLAAEPAEPHRFDAAQATKR